MLFNSWSFVVFYPVVTALYFGTPHRLRWLLLLVASAVFYMAFVPSYLFILILAIAVDFTAGILIGRSTGRRRREWLLVSIAANLSILFFFKYYNFFSWNAGLAFRLFGVHEPLPMLHIVLPIGLSFHIFQSLSYTIEVYRGNQEPERHLGIYALYVMFYPQLVAGPIERPQNLLHQFHAEHRFDFDSFRRGLERMLWGLFKKTVIADRLATMVGAIYDRPTAHTGLPLVLATVCFSIQIYCDFSGYSDIALGAAETMGITLMQNFRAPYQATTISEFWTRWHISLSTWFRDYVYIPLGGNRVSPARHNANLFVVFLVSGLWHGASWNFVLWGALHGGYLVFAAWSKPARAQLATRLGLARWPLLRRHAQQLVVFVLVSYAWIFFRAQTLPDAFYVATHLQAGLVAQVSSLSAISRSIVELHASKLDLSIALAAVILLTIADAWPEWLRRRLDLLPAPLRWSGAYAAVLSVILLGAHRSSAFIYFQF